MLWCSRLGHRAWARSGSAASLGWDRVQTVEDLGGVVLEPSCWVVGSEDPFSPLNIYKYIPSPTSPPDN